jgi:hypothetical protein
VLERTWFKLFPRELFLKGIAPLGTHWLALGGAIPLWSILNYVPQGATVFPQGATIFPHGANVINFA